MLFNQEQERLIDTAGYFQARRRLYMGIYVNPGNTAFKEAVNSQIYVDKS